MSAPTPQAGSFRLGSRHVNRLGYGAMQLAGPGAFGPPKDRAAAVAVLRAAASKRESVIGVWIGEQRGERGDHDGQWARQGKLDAGLLRVMLSDPCFALPAPKSTGRGLFKAQWLRAMLARTGDTCAPVDVQRTLLELTARSIAEAIDGVGLVPGDVVMCGGGARNVMLRERLSELPPPWTMQACDAFGTPSQSMEVLAFATFALRTLRGLDSSTPSATGASRPCRLGTVFAP